MAGNISKCLTIFFLNTISSEFKKSLRFHDNVVTELMITQKILRECDTGFFNFPGYNQHLQVDPFAVQMYTEQGMEILLSHLKDNHNTTLYLDATRGIVSKIPNQAKKVLYYALVLPRDGSSKPPLPVTEMLTNKHNVPNISSWLLKFVHSVSKLTSVRVHRIEIDFSWALIQSVLVSFNKENVDTFLDRAHKICHFQLQRKDVKRFTVVHICAAHMVKTFSNAARKHTTDKGLHNFAVFCFALFKNSITLHQAKAIFLQMCFVFLAEKNTPTVEAAVVKLNNYIKQIAVDVEDDIFLKASIPAEDDIQMSKNTIIGRSQFTLEFLKVTKESMNVLEKEERTISVETCETCGKTVETCQSMPLTQQNHLNQR